MKNIVHKSLFLIAFVMTMSFTNTYAEPLDSVFDSIMAVEEKQFDADAYYEELVTQYGGEDYKRLQAVQKRFAVDEEQAAAEAAKRKSKRVLAFILSLIIALFPTAVIVNRVIIGELKPANKAAVWRTVGMLLFYGIVLFALNYAWLWCLFMGETKIMGAVLGLCLFAFVIYAIYTLRKYHKKNENKNPQNQ